MNSPYRASPDDFATTNAHSGSVSGLSASHFQVAAPVPSPSAPVFRRAAPGFVAPDRTIAGTHPILTAPHQEIGRRAAPRPFRNVIRAGSI
jgi:hypothetical protein